MKYDVMIAGGGPAGLMAAKTAVQDGMKTILFEAKNDITRIDRACSQIFYIRKLSPSGSAESGKGRALSDGYIDPVTAETRTECTRLHFPVPGFFLDYKGPLRPYLNWYHISPKGFLVNRYERNERPWGFYYNKEILVSGLIEEATKSGAVIQAGTRVVSAENIKDGVQLKVESSTGTTTYSGSAAIAADGLFSQVVETGGLNRNRKTWDGRRLNYMQYILDGFNTDIRDAACSWLTWTVPSVNPDGFVAVGLSTDGCVKIGARVAGELSPVAVLARFMEDARFSGMFRNSKIVKKEATGRTRGFYEPVVNPVVGNIIVVGDAGAINETWIQGAIASGYQAIKAIGKERENRGGFEEYRRWWYQAFAFNTPEYTKMVSQMYPLPKICSDDEIDYLWSLLKGKTGIPQVMISGCLDQIAVERPDLHKRLINSLSRVR
jgi:flavin-dependent dehydrogenase